MDPTQPSGSPLESTVTQLSAGAQLGPYRIEAPIGAGGMGEVFRARDTRLNRTVAIKILHIRFAKRFEREALAIAQLNHPNICTLYDIGPNYLVMEHIEGRTLAALIAAGPMPIAQALDIACQVGQGLRVAHERGVLHRDIKPANIMVTPDGQAKIMDFGLAKLATTSDGECEPTDSIPLTAPGAVMGTPSYMSPEQAKGEPADQRSDIWALGVVLYEMLSGQRPFRGESPIAVLRAILDDEPRRLPAQALSQIVARALAKDCSKRYQRVEEMVSDLKAVDTPAKPARRWALVAVVAVGLVAGVLLMRDRWGGAPRRVQAEQITAFPDSATNPGLSPDGRMLAFIRGPDTFTTSGQIYVKLLPSGEPVQLTHDQETKMHPMFTPDGSRIVYTVRTAQGSWDTWSVPVMGGEARLMLPNASGLTWLDPRRILFSEIKAGTVLHMAIVTSAVSRAESRDVYVPEEIRGMAHRSYLSPDGKSVLLTEMVAGFLPCRLVPFDGSSKGRVAGPAPGKCTYAAWSPDGQWMYFSANTSGSFQVWRQRFPDGKPEQLTFGPTESEGIAVSPDGRSLITSLGLRQRSVWLHDGKGDRQISSEGSAMLPAWGDGFPTSVFSPDGTKLYYLVIVEKAGQRGFGSGELWVSDLASGSNEAFLPGLTINTYDFSPDGRQLVFAAIGAEGKSRIWVTPVNRRSAPQMLAPAEAFGPVFGDNNTVYFRGPSGGQFYIQELKLDSGQVRQFTPEPATNAPAVSPDGRWIISTAPVAGQDTSGIVRAYPRQGGAPIDVCAACFLKWTRDGRTLYILWAPGNFNGGGNTYRVTLPAGKTLPPLPAGGLKAEADFLKLPGLRVIKEVNLFSGPSEAVYAFEKQFVQRNLYRIPLP